MYKTLLVHLGPQHWWPGRTRFEVCVGAILTQNASWSNVEKALRRIRQANALSPAAIDRASVKTVAGWLKPVGYFNVKAARLKAFVQLVAKDYGGSLRRLFTLDTAALRKALLGVHGIGPETADSILLYAAARPVFVVDAYTRRILARHGWVAPDSSYEHIAAVFGAQVGPDVATYNEYHALLVAVGKEWCRPVPRCASCPLRAYLPRGGPKV